VISGVCSLAAVLGADADLLEAAAWLHDIGYTADVATAGLHALDGARYLRDAQLRRDRLAVGGTDTHHSLVGRREMQPGEVLLLSLRFNLWVSVLRKPLGMCSTILCPGCLTCYYGRRPGFA